MAYKLEPFEDRVVVKLDEKVEKVLNSGIVIPERAQEQSRFGTVLAVGPGKTLPYGNVQTIPLNIGDRVVVTKYGGSELTIDGETTITVPFPEIIGRIAKADIPKVKLEDLEKFAASSS